jgi:hypothetical protein
MFGPNPPRLSIFGRVARARRVVAAPLRVVTRVATSARERVIVIARGVAIASFLRRRVVSRRVASARFRGPRGAARARGRAREDARRATPARDRTVSSNGRRERGRRGRAGGRTDDERRHRATRGGDAVTTRANRARKRRARASGMRARGRGRERATGAREEATRRRAGCRWGHSTRALTALAPALCVTLGSGGETMVTVVAIGASAARGMDAMGNGEGALGAIWTTATAALGTLLTRGSWRTSATVGTSCALLAVNGVNLFLFCSWCTLQFRWIHESHAGAAATCERLIFALCPPTTTTILTWAFASASAGAERAAFYGSVVSLITHRMFLFPCASACAAVTKTNGPPSDKRSALTESDAEYATVATLGLPVALYLWTNLDTLFKSLDHVFACGALVTVPVLYLIAAGTEKSLWWRARGVDVASKRMETAVLLFALTGFAVSVEGGIIFSEFAEYIEIMAPLNYIMVTVSVHSALAVFAACYANAVGDGVPTGAVKATLALSTSTAICALGAPLWMIPIPIAGSSSFVKYYYEDREPKDYGVFAASCVGCFSWFLSKNFWSLDVRVGAFDVKQLCVAILLLAVAALALPAVLNTKSARAPTVGVLVVCYVSALATIEQILSQATHDDDSLIYPPYLVIVTSISGFLASRGLVISGRISREFGWVMQSVCGAKLSMLFVRGLKEMFSVLVVVLAITAPHAMSRRMTQLSPGASVGYCVALVFSLVFARFAMFDVIFELSGHRPTDATLFGGLLLITGASLASVVTRQSYGDDMFSKRLMMLLSFCGVFLITFRPPMPWKGEVGMWYDAEHVPDSEEDEARMYGVRENAHHGWPSWLLMLAALTAIFAVSSPRQQTKSTSTIRIALSAVCGGSVGLYMALEFFVQQVALTALLFVACALVGVFLSFTYSPSPKSSRWLPYVYLSFVSVLGLAYVTQMGGSDETVDDHQARMEGKFGVVGVFAGTSLQIAFALKLRIKTSLESVQHRRRQGGTSPFLPATGRSRPEYFRGVASRNEHRELKAKAIAWMPIIGNIATLTSFLACVVLSDELADGSAFSVFVLAPILLLLHQDSVIFPILEDSQRYAPPLAMIVGKMCWDAVAAILAGPNRVHVLAATASKLPWMTLNALSLLLASVNSINLVHYLATSVRTDGMTLILTAPLAVVAPFLSKIPSVRALAFTSLIAVVTQHTLQRRAKIVGLKYL